MWAKYIVPRHQEPRGETGLHGEPLFVKVTVDAVGRIKMQMPADQNQGDNEDAQWNH